MGHASPHHRAFNTYEISARSIEYTQIQLATAARNGLSLIFSLSTSSFAVVTALRASVDLYVGRYGGCDQLGQIGHAPL